MAHAAYSDGDGSHQPPEDSKRQRVDVVRVIELLQEEFPGKLNG